MSYRPRCEGSESASCRAWPIWRVRWKGDSLDRNWFHACGRHLNQVALTQASDAGVELDLVRILAI